MTALLHNISPSKSSYGPIKKRLLWTSCMLRPQSDFFTAVCFSQHKLQVTLLQIILYSTLSSSHPNTYYAMCIFCGPGSSVGIATGYGLDGPGIESRWEARFSAPVQTGPGAHPASCTMGTGFFPGVKSGRGVTLTPHTLLVVLVMKE